ncbi:alpha/beta hydrolase [soil metagenome]
MATMTSMHETPTPAMAALLLSLAQARKGQPSRYAMPFPQSREQLSREREPWLDDGPACDVVATRIEASHPARCIPIQLIRPAAVDECLLLVYLHGGGWCVGSPRTHEAIVRRLATAMRCTAWSVDYALAPERAFPAGLLDCVAAIEQAAIQHPGARIVVAGDSAGANLALAATLWLRDHQRPLPAALLLFYGVYTDSLGSGSVRAYGDGRYGLSLEAHERYLRAYFDGASVSPEQRPYAFQLDPVCDLSGLPPAFLLAAQLDILRDQGDAMAAALEAAGGDVESVEAGGVIHGFLSYGKVLPEVGESLDAAARFALSCVRSPDVAGSVDC